MRQAKANELIFEIIRGGVYLCLCRNCCKR